MAAHEPDGGGGILVGSPGDSPPRTQEAAFEMWRLRGAPYTHDGPCAREACNKCYKYACALCGERSNLSMACSFCRPRPAR